MYEPRSQPKALSPHPESGKAIFGAIATFFVEQPATENENKKMVFMYLFISRPTFLVNKDEYTLNWKKMKFIPSSVMYCQFQPTFPGTAEPRRNRLILSGYYYTVYCYSYQAYPFSFSFKNSHLHVLEKCPLEFVLLLVGHGTKSGGG